MSVKRIGGLLASILAACLIGYAPFYNNGVFFPLGVARAGLVGTILLLILSGSFAIRHLQNRAKSSTIRLYDIAVAGYVLLYVIGVSYAASPEDALIRAIGFLVCGLVYIGLRQFGKSILSTLILPALAIASVGINVVGMANGWHQLYFPSAFDPQFFRVQSVFQYHNAYAAYVGAIGLALFIWATLARSGLIWRSAALGFAGLNVLGLIVSNSRGAQALWAVSLVLVFIGLRPLDDRKLRSRLLLNFYAVSVGAGIGYILVRHALHHNLPTLGWGGICLSLIIPFVLGVITALLPTTLRGRIDTDKAIWVLIGIGVLIFAVLAVVARHMLMAKLASYHLHQLSVSQRFIFWQDAWHITLRDPLFGSGGNAWPALWQMYQSYPYYSSQSHSFIMDTLTDVGIVGFVLLLASWWPIARTVVWPVTSSGTAKNSPTGSNMPDGSTWLKFSPSIAERRSLSAMSLFLILHSAMDWDMAFLSLLMLLFIGMGASASLLAEEASDQKGFARPIRLPRSTTASLWGLVALVSLGGVYATVQTVRAQHDATVAANTPDPGAKLNLYTKASAATPWDSQYYADQAVILLDAQNNGEAKQALTLLKIAYRHDPFNANLATEAASTAFQLGDFSTSYNYAMDADRDAPFLSQHLSTAINAAAVEGLATARSNPTQANQYFQEVARLYGEFQKRKQVVDHLPSYLPPLGGSFTLEPFCYDSLAAASMALGNQNAATQFADIATKSSDTHTKDLGQLILLVLKEKTGGSPQAIKTFVNEHPDVQASYRLLKNIH